MIRIAICDNEEIFLRREESAVREYFTDCKQSFSIDIFKSGKDFVKNRDIKYDFVFLDADIEEIEGMDTAKRIRKFSEKLNLIFLTSSIRYFSDGYQVNASRYIIKDDFLEKSIAECLDSLVPEICLRQDGILFPFREGPRRIKYEDILYVEISFHVTCFYLDIKERNQFTLVGRYRFVADWIHRSDFVLVKKGCFVNFKHVKAVDRYSLILTNGDRLSVARSCYEKVCQEFISYKGRI